MFAALASSAALLVPTPASAAPAPAPLTGIDFDVAVFTQYGGPTIFHVTDALLVMVSSDTACWQLSVAGEPIWKDIDGDGVGEWLVQNPSPWTIQGACWGVTGIRANYIPIADCEAGTVNLSSTGGPGAASPPYYGSVTGQLEYIYVDVQVPLLTADTREERRAVCSLARTATNRGVSDAEYVQQLNETLALLSG
jgi:hypothetical protein